MIFEISEQELKSLVLPFNVYLPEKRHDKITLRMSYYRHPTLKIWFPEEQITIKEFFMDWFYYGFPKNHMKSSNEYFGKETIQEIEIDGIKRTLFTGIDYENSYSSCLFLNGTCLEIRHNRSSLEDVIEIIKTLKEVNSSKKSNFLSRSFYANPPGEVFWFEETRISRIKWKTINDQSIFDSRSFDLGFLNNDQKLIIFENSQGDYVFIDMSKNTKLVKNLRYSFKGTAPIFVKVERGRDYIMGIISEFGPMVYQFFQKDFSLTITVPSVKSFDFGKEQILHILKKLKSDSFLDDYAIQI